ncbi:MAG: hypothetical protein JSR46_02535, partial [Verrucomicrobia bacterium]|nr:hypothetical protein [Verrucomicrobiota bacterium]
MSLFNGIPSNFCLSPPLSVERATKQVETPESRFEHFLALAKAGEPIAAPLRLALHICLQLDRKVFNPIGDLFRKSSLFAADLFAQVHEGTAPLNRAEIAYLFDEFLNAFDTMVTERNQRSVCTLETLSFQWSVDYGARGELARIMEAGYSKVQEARKAVNGLPVPPTFGHGFKCQYRVEGATAYCNSQVIDHSGRLLEEHPWETFYKTGKASDEKLALELSPEIPCDIKNKFENRKIIQHKGYTFNKSAEKLCLSDNWGLVMHLAEEDKDISPAVGQRVLKRAIASGLQKAICCFEEYNDFEGSLLDDMEALSLVDVEAAPLEDQEIVSHMDYTFDSHAEQFALGDNWGLVRSLMRGSFAEEVASKVLGLAILEKKWDICEVLFGAGVPLETSNGWGPYSAFIHTIRKCDSAILTRILKRTVPGVSVPAYDLKHFEEIGRAFYCRFRSDGPARDKQQENEVLALLTKVWIKAHVPKYGIAMPMIKKHEISFYKEIISNTGSFNKPSHIFSN